MLEIMPPDEIEDDWPFGPCYGPPRPPRTRQTSESRLAHLRWTYAADAFARLATRAGPVRVVTYVLVTPGVAPQAAHARLAELAKKRGWRVCRAHFTEYPVTGAEAEPRPELERACANVKLGLADGILATSRHDIPASSDTYEHILRRLDRSCGFLSYLSPAMQPSTASKGTYR
ncbi:hypothetical protein MHW47_05165 [Streptomyces sp. OfavH-34-F]|uniref:hypothetical protein n=1 Tax=Streptomyces sp. OfavH-34-F TaxID=2917760 RepID=UPI001EF2E41E|nr:hypothetical protein [Streptomyces sp. OfavH-34-F]MCG7523838.1 hypothetical protein [Streptomyces sp. OfavH-34-F]